MMMAQALPVPQQRPHSIDSPSLSCHSEITSATTPSNETAEPAALSTSLPMARLLRTTHTDDGTSVFSSDALIPQVSPFGPQGTSFTVFDTRSAIPANNMSPTPASSDALPMCPPKGAIFCLADIPAGGSVPVHRTQTLDYCTVLSGEIVVGLDGGEEKVVKAGDFIVQQGVNHEWANRTSETCRVLFVMLGAEKVQLQTGKVLEPTVF